MAIFNYLASGGIQGPPTKTSGNILKYNGTEWVAANQAVTSVNGKTGAVSLTASDVGAAAATHAARHKTGGADPLTPANIGAMSTTYESKTGTLSNSTILSSTYSFTYYKIGRIAFVYTGTSFNTVKNKPVGSTDYVLASGLYPSKVEIPYEILPDTQGSIPASLVVNASGQLIFRTYNAVGSSTTYRRLTFPYITAS